MHLHAVPQGILERAHDVGAGPAQRLGQRLGVIVCGARPGPRASRLGQDDPGAVRQDLGRHRQLVEHERRSRVEPLGSQALGDPASRSAIRSSPTRTSRIACPRPHVLVQDQLTRRADLGDVDRARSTAGSRARTGGSIRSRRPRTPGASAGAASAGNTSSTPPRTANSPRLLHHVDPRVAEIDESLGETIRSGSAAAFDPDRLGRPRRRRDPCSAASTGATTTRGPLGGAQPPDGGSPPRRNLGRRRDQLVGQGLPRRQQHRAARQERGHVGDQRLGLVRPRRDGEDRHARAPSPGRPGRRRRPSRPAPRSDGRATSGAARTAPIRSTPARDP